MQVCSEHGVYFEGGDLWRVLADRHERLSALDRSTTRASQKRVFGIPSGVVPAVVVIVVLQLLAMLKNC